MSVVYLKPWSAIYSGRTVGLAGQLQCLTFRPDQHHVDLPLRGMHPDPEAGQLAVPEQRVPVDLQRVHRPLREAARIPR